MNLRTSLFCASENKMVVYNILSTILVAGINFLTIPIFTRILDTDGFGLVNIYIAWVQIFSIFIGLKADGSIGSAYANLSEDSRDSYQFSVLIIGMLTFIASLAFYFLESDWLVSVLNMSSIAIFAMILQSFGTFVISLFSMRFIFDKDAKSNLYLSVGVATLTTLLSVFMIFSHVFGAFPYLGRVFGLALPNLFIAIFLICNLLKRKPSLNLSYWKFCFTLSLPLVFHGLSQLLLAQTGKIVIQDYMGNSLAGIYSISVTVVSLLGAIYSALNNAFVPFMYDDLSGKTTPERKVGRFYNYFVLFTFGTCAFSLLSPEILKVLSTREYWSAISYLPFLIFGQYCVFLYSFPVNYEFYKMQTRSIAFGTMAAGLVNLFLCFKLIPFFGLYGAAFSTAFSYMLLFCFHFFVSRYLLGDYNYPAKVYLKGLILVAFVCTSSVLMSNLIIFRWILGSFILFILLARIYKTKVIF